MKRKLNLFLAALSMVALASCAKELVDVDETAVQTETTFTFDLGADEGVDTKTAMINKKTCWVSGDQIAVTDGTTTEILTVPVQNTWNSVTTIRSNKTFEGTVYAVYPVDALKSVENGKLLVDIPAVQSGLFEDCNIMVGRNVNNGFSMKNATAVMKVDAYRDNLDITLIAPNSAISGEMYVELGEDGLISSEEMKSSAGAITVHAEKRGQYYVAVAPGTYASGFTVMGVSRDSGLYESKTASVSNTLAAGDITKLGTIGTRLKGMEGSGSSYDPYRITNTAEWYLFAKSVNEGDDYAGKSVMLAEDGVVATVPAGWYDSTNDVDYYFKGTFMGCGHTITLALDKTNAPGTTGIALFGELGAGASVEALTFAGTVNGGDYSAALAGYINAGVDGVSIKDCRNQATISGNDYVAGFIAYADGDLTVQNCMNQGPVSGRNYVAGYIANNKSSVSFAQMLNQGKITATGNYVGGFVGINNGSALQITGCTNMGEVSGDAYVGGIVGQDKFQGGVYTSVANSAAVSGGYNVAGIVGYDYYSTFTNCSNVASVTGKTNCGRYIGLPKGSWRFSLLDGSSDQGNYSFNTDNTRGIGGIVGYGQNATIKTCSNSGAITGISKVGGIIGTAYWSSTSECRNQGTVKASAATAGGIYGWIYTQASSNKDKNYGSVSATALAGGIVGFSNSSTSSATITIKDATNSGSVYATGGQTIAEYNYNWQNVSGAGGIVGGVRELANGSKKGVTCITGCENGGSVTGGGIAVGGIVGYSARPLNNVSTGYIKKCSNRGNVFGFTNVGGIAGIIFHRFTSCTVQVSDCENTAPVTASSTTSNGVFAGGIIGWISSAYPAAGNMGYVSNNMNTGSVLYSNSASTAPNVGGIVGSINQAQLANNYNSGYVGLDSGTAAEGAADYTGAIAGQIGARSAANYCYYTGNQDKAVGKSAVTLGECISSVNNGVTLATPATVFGSECTTLLGALNAWSANYSSYGYYTWTSGPSFVK